MIKIYNSESIPKKYLMDFLKQEDTLNEGSFLAFEDKKHIKYAMEIKRDLWEESIIGVPVYKLNFYGDLKKLSANFLRSALNNFIKENNKIYILTRISTNNVPLVTNLQEIGFKTIEILVELAVTSKKMAPISNKNISFRNARNKDIPLLLTFIAGRVYSRYYMDPLLGINYEKKAYKLWLKNAVEGNENIIVATSSGKVIGFCS